MRMDTTGLVSLLGSAQMSSTRHELTGGRDGEHLHAISIRHVVLLACMSRSWDMGRSDLAGMLSNEYRDFCDITRDSWYLCCCLADSNE